MYSTDTTTDAHAQRILKPTRGNPSKGGLTKANNARGRAAKVSALKVQLESLADSPAKQALVPIILADYKWILQLEICHRPAGRLARLCRRPSEKQIARVKRRFTALM